MTQEARDLFDALEQSRSEQAVLDDRVECSPAKEIKKACRPYAASNSMTAAVSDGFDQLG